MPTLRDVWLQRGMNSAEVAYKAKCSVATLYKLNRKGAEAEGVALGIIKRVCAVLRLTLDEFDRLDACPMADRYKDKG